MPLIARRVCIESPLRGEVPRNVTYADACMLDALRRGEAPYLGHLLYPRVLDDARPEDRELGIAAHIAWLRFADMLVVYTDRGITDGMQRALELAHTLRIPIEYRQLGPAWSTRFNVDAHTTDGFFVGWRGVSNTDDASKCTCFAGFPYPIPCPVHPTAPT